MTTDGSAPDRMGHDDVAGHLDARPRRDALLRQGERREEHTRSPRAHGITREAVWIQSSPAGDVAIVLIDHQIWLTHSSGWPPLPGALRPKAPSSRQTDAAPLTGLALAELRSTPPYAVERSDARSTPVTPATAARTVG